MNHVFNQGRPQNYMKGGDRSSVQCLGVGGARACQWNRRASSRPKRFELLAKKFGQPKTSWEFYENTVFNLYLTV
jgi:hypothetical protein